MLKSIYPVITSEKSLPFYLTGIGQTDPEYHIIRDKGLSSHQFLFTISGQGIFKCQGKEMILEEKDLLYMPPGVVHEYLPRQEDWQTKWMVFRGDYIDSLMKNLGFKNWFVKEVEDFTPIEDAFNRLFKLSESMENKEKCSILLYEYILLVQKSCLLESSPLTNGHVKKAILFMEENYSRDLTIEEIAASAGLSIQHFCRIFHQVMKMRPLEFLARKRISQAKNLLENSEMTVAQVGQAVGYPDKNYFGIVFKAHEGLSPGKWKLQ
ncbi:MAG: helix-turn-helix domain-containing protein [Treponema sp.]|nr:helix-turn-helix domain-containing protein [Treponema sp.]